ncbi:DNA polymerase III, chi subunit [Aliiroseovarius sediminilitoris]|uniref:DNA polymerase III, chi subunit n=1 Tax=Aliiroseovarius sediminilitoris TaxID=1173584 RepID=A0A1I0PYP6_9RHOB|nr:DNA polymerase III subunit chi [Aliiroseovarius sediminilitoris]SEW19575.1 DNA polymerase III, chi subunit [Aliiroseovarius sediminilitoris]
MSDPATGTQDGQGALHDKTGEVFFYHMTRSPLEATLPVLLQRSLEAGWKICLRGTDPKRMAWLDERLWTTSDDGFLPHGQSGGPHDADQPVLLTTDTTIPNQANALIAVDGAAVDAEELAGLTRVSILFDGNDPDAVVHARSQWKEVAAAGLTAKYWSQESGRWEMKASS